MIPYPDLDHYPPIEWDHFNWFLKAGVPVETLIDLTPIRLAHGYKAHDGRFDQDHRDDLGGNPWLVFPEPEDCVFWQPRTGEITTWNGRAFALGEHMIDAPETYSFDCNLNVFSDPLEWLKGRCDGCVVLDWSRAFDRLRDAPRIAVSESLLFQYRRHMQPRHMPAVAVIADARRAAA